MNGMEFSLQSLLERHCVVICVTVLLSGLDDLENFAQCSKVS